jgi:hypothetical protein
VSAIPAVETPRLCLRGWREADAGTREGVWLHADLGVHDESVAEAPFG